MNCTSCGREPPAGSVFCNGCGARLVVTCARCGATPPPDSRFCNGCGATLGADQTAAPGQTAPPHTQAVSIPERDPRAYTPKHLADRILQSRSALEGERKQVTVLFADVKGSMELSEQLDPEEWHRILERFFAILTEGVHRFEGTVNQYTGDGIMALFGAPIAHEDHAQRACYAGLHLRDALRDFAREVKRQNGLDFATRIGINSGEVVVGRIGDDLRMDYTAQGHTVGLAQRMESLASSGSIYLSAYTARLAQGYFDLEDLGAFTVKGVNEPVHVYELQQVGSARSRFDISRTRGFSRFVGRAADLRTLEDALALSADGNGQVIGVVAEAGTGKSRLCFEFLETCRARGFQVFEARAVSHGKNVPLLPILELFRAYFGITALDDERSTREKIAGRMIMLDRKFADTLPLVFDFLGVSDPQNPAPEIGAEARQRQLLAVMRQVIKSASENRPTLTLIEDLHWLDASSAEFLEHLVEAREGSRSLLLLNFRPEYQAEWMQKSWYRQIPLTPLGRDAIAELLADLLGSHPSIAALVSPIHTRTGGNPFFTEEVVQSLIESGHLQGARGACQLITPIERLEVPPTVQAVLAARIDRLPEREKQLLQVASVIGKDFTETLLAEVAGLPADGLKSALAALRRAEFILELSIYPAVEYTFKHPLTQEVALHSQLQTRRRQVHAKVARAIEQQDAEHLDERAPLLAQHWEEAGEAFTAARWHRRAAEWVGRTDVAAAARNWQSVRTLLRQLPRGRETAALGFAACRMLLAAMSWRMAVQLGEARELFEEAQAYANSMGNQRDSLFLAMNYSYILRADGDIPAFHKQVLLNKDAAIALQDPVVLVHATTAVATALEETGQFAESLNQFDGGLPPHPMPRDEWLLGISPRVLTRCYRGKSFMATGDLQQALNEHAKGLVEGKEDGTPETTSYIHGFITETHYLAGDKERALASAQFAESAGQGLDNAGLGAHLLLVRGYAQLLAGLTGDAVVTSRESLNLYRRSDRVRAGEAAAFHAESLLADGNAPAAQAAAEEAITICGRSRRATYEAVAHGVLARALLRQHGSAARTSVEAELALAAELIERTGARTFLASLLEWRAEVAGVCGFAEERLQLLRQAQAVFAEIGAPLQASRISEQLGMST